MADKKISALTAATTPLDGTEVLPIVQSGATKKVANNDLRPRQIQSNATSGVLQIVGPAAAATRVMTTPDANFTAARTDAANSFSGNQTLSDGNLVVGTAGKGIDFSANTNAAGMTSELLTWYEEGTWTGSLTGGTTGATTPVTATGRYTRIGRQVAVQINFSNVNTSGASGVLLVTGLPFANSSQGSFGACYFIGMGTAVGTAYVQPSASQVAFLNSTTGTYIDIVAASGKYTGFAAFYTV